jgi:hypothetical protein
MDFASYYNDPGPKTWGLIFFVVFMLSTCVLRRVASCCLSSQRIKLRDEYERELRNGGQLTNRLLLPAVNATHFDTRRLQV